ncbi:MAG: nuclear transport factor 2 family protein [Candidatus Colwellbacteria bacterium]|nr:nuclear transport factor 2 family protein [Candidatus Colwellbacteria bacterium]
MGLKETIKKYLSALEKSDYENLISLFALNATVHSPLYGEVEAKKFYKNLFKNTNKSVISLKDIFMSEDNLKGAVNFLYDWTLSDGSQVSFDCVDIFKFNSDGKIQELTIIYDTSQTRPKFDKLKI